MFETVILEPCVAVTGGDPFQLDVCLAAGAERNRLVASAIRGSAAVALAPEVVFG